MLVLLLPQLVLTFIRRRLIASLASGSLSRTVRVWRIFGNWSWDFSFTHSRPYFKAMVREIQDVGRGIELPILNEIMGSYINEEVTDVTTYYVWWMNYPRRSVINCLMFFVLLVLFSSYILMLSTSTRMDTTFLGWWMLLVGRLVSSQLFRLPDRYATSL